MLNRAREVQGEKGMANIKFPSGNIGPHSYAGVIQVKDPFGNVQSYPFAEEYIVAPPSLTVAATKMNVFYIGSITLFQFLFLVWLKTILMLPLQQVANW